MEMRVDSGRTDDFTNFVKRKVDSSPSLLCLCPFGRFVLSPLVPRVVEVDNNIF